MSNKLQAGDNAMIYRDDSHSGVTFYGSRINPLHCIKPSISRDTVVPVRRAKKAEMFRGNHWGQCFG